MADSRPTDTAGDALEQRLAGKPFEVVPCQAGHTIHVIVEATDSGTPSLTRYQRIVLTIHPPGALT